MAGLIARIAGRIQLLIVVWLASGVALPLAWCCTALRCISLAFGLAVAGDHPKAAQDFISVGLAVAGLLLSPFNPFRITF